MKRWVKIILLSFIGLLVALTVALQAILKSDFLKEKLLEAASGYVDAALEVSELDFGLLRTYPDVEARFCGLSVTCPPPRPDASVCDTLLRADTVILRLNLPALSAGRIDVRRAHLNGVRLYARRYDSLSVNWDVLALPENPEDRADTVRAEFPRVNVREFSLGPDCLLVLDDLPSSMSVRVSPGSVRLSGRIGPGRRAPRVSGISLSVDSLKAGLVSGTDSLDYTLAGLRVEQTGRGSFSLAAESRADLSSADFGSMAVPFNLDGELAYAFLPEGLGVSASGLSVYLACMPFFLDGSVLLGDGYADMDASLSLVECRLEDVLHDYAAGFDPYAASFGTDAVLSADFTAKGRLGGGSLPEFSACVRIPQSHTEYLPDGSTLDLEADVDMELSAGRMLTADIHTFKASVDGIDLDLGGSADDLLGEDPLFSVEARACADIGRLGRFIPESLGLRKAEGRIELDLSASTRRSNLSDFRFRNAYIDGTLHAGTLSVATDSADLSAFNALVSLKSEPDGLGVELDFDSLYFNSGRDVIARVRNIHNSAGIVKAESRGTAVPRMSVSTESDMIFLKLGNARYGVSGAGISASAQRRVQARRDGRPGRGGVRDRRRGRAVRAVRDFARRDRDFAAADIDISLDSSVVRYLRNWSLSGHIKADAGMMASRELPLRTRLTALHADFDDERIVLDTLGVRCGTSDFNMSGTVTGVKRALMRRSRIGADLFLNSERININEMVAASLIGSRDEASVDPSVELDESFVTDTLADASIDIEDLPLLIVPGNVDARVRLNAGKVDFLEPEIGPVISGIRIKDRTMQLTGTDIFADFGHIYADAFYSTRSKRDISAGVNLDLDSMQVDRVIGLLPIVDSLMPALKTFEGNVSCEISATTQLDSNMNVVIPTLDGVLRVRGKDMKLYSDGRFGKLADMLLFGKTGVMNIDNLSADAIVHDSRLEVFPFDLGIDRFKLALQGSQGFDKSMQYHVSVLKSPLLLRFGIDIYGTLDNWKMSLGRARLSGGNIPAFTAQLDTVQLNLANSIRDIYDRGVGDVVDFNRRELGSLYGRKLHIDSVSGDDEHLDAVAREGYAEMFSEIIYERELEAQTAQAMNEIDSVLESTMPDMASLMEQHEMSMFDRRLQRRIERMERRQQRRELRQERRAERASRLAGTDVAE